MIVACLVYKITPDALGLYRKYMYICSNNPKRTMPM